MVAEIWFERICHQRCRAKARCRLVLRLNVQVDAVLEVHNDEGEEKTEQKPKLHKLEGEPVPANEVITWKPGRALATQVSYGAGTPRQCRCRLVHGQVDADTKQRTPLAKAEWHRPWGSCTPHGSLPVTGGKYFPGLSGPNLISQRNRFGEFSKESHTNSNHSCLYQILRCKKD